MKSVICLDDYVEKLIHYIRDSDAFARMLVLQTDRCEFIYEVNNYWVYKISADLIKRDSEDDKVPKVIDGYNLVNIKVYCDVGLLYFELSFKWDIQFVVETNGYTPSNDEKIEPKLLLSINKENSIKPMNIKTYDTLLFMSTLKKEQLEKRMKIVDILHNSSYTKERYIYFFDYSLLYVFDATDLVNFMAELLEQEVDTPIVDKVMIRISCENKTKELLKWSEMIYTTLYQCYQKLNGSQIEWVISVFSFYGNVKNYRELESYFMDRLNQDGHWFRYEYEFHSNH